MTNIFEITAQRLVEIGFYNFLLPFILFSVLVYALLRKTQILGDSPVIHGIVAISAGLLIFGLPVTLGGSGVVGPLTGFLTQGIVAIVVLVVGFLIASFFVPNLQEKLPEIFKNGGPAVLMIWVVVAFAIIFGLFGFVGKPLGNFITKARIPTDFLSLTIIVIIAFIALLLITMSSGKEGGN